MVTNTANTTLPTVTKTKLPRLSGGTPLVDGKGVPSGYFHQYWNQVVSSVEAQLGSLEIAQAALIAAANAQTTANSAQLGVQTNANNIAALIFSSGATATSGPTSPAGPNNTGAFTMQGLAGSITPKSSGNILVAISGTFTSSAALVDQGISVQGSWGTGAAPGSNAALTGTQAGAVITWTNLVAATLAADVNVPFTAVFLIVGAALGTALWLDLAAEAITTASTFACAGVVITAAEV